MCRGKGETLLLGHGSSDSLNSPKLVDGISKVIDVVMANESVLVHTEEDNLFALGKGCGNDLGIDAEDASIPRPVPLANKCKFISAISGHSQVEWDVISLMIHRDYHSFCFPIPVLSHIVC